MSHTCIRDSELIPINYEDPEAHQQIYNSLKECGFALLENHPIPLNLLTAIEKDWHQFFESPVKHQYLFHPDTQDGYFPRKAEAAKGAQVKDDKEFFHFYPDGQIPTELRPQVEEYLECSLALGCRLLRVIEDKCPQPVREGFSGPLADIVGKQEQTTLVRILYYPPNPATIRAAPHEDINLITILPSAVQPGLQLKYKDQWIDVPANPKYLVINVGDMLQEMSNFELPSATHRVILHPGQSAEKPRISMPCFIHAKPETRLSDRYTARAYLLERLRELGLKD